MMSRGRSPFGMLFMVGFGVLIGAVLFGGAEAVGTVLAAPFVALGFIFKVVLFFMLMGLVFRLLARGNGGRRGKCWSGPSRQEWSNRTHPRWHDRSGSSDNDTVDSTGDRFDEWHRMAHARQEVDDHTPPIEE